MSILPATLLFFTTTRGHFERKDIYKTTLQDLNNQSLFFEDAIVHSKVSSNELDFYNNEQRPDLQSFRLFKKCLFTVDNWSHFQPSHALGQLKDIIKSIKQVRTEFIFHLEDDWLLYSDKNTISYFFNQAIELLKSGKDVMQVRIPRHKDEQNHYKTIEKLGDVYNRQGEIWSFNPNICRTRDVQIICNLIEKNWQSIEQSINAGQINAELLFTQIARNLSLENKPFYSFNPEFIRCLHIGTKEGEEDKI